jgi:hypothetical protein
MADNVTFQPTTATPVSGTVVGGDEIGGVIYQRIKLVTGTTPDDVSASAPLQVEIVGNDNYQLYEYSGGNLLYRGVNPVHGAAEAATTWVVQKYTYGANGITKLERLTGAWSGRAALAWT